MRSVPSVAWLTNAQAIVAVAGLVVLYALEGWVPFAADRSHRVRHAARNLSLSLVNIAVLALVFAGVTSFVVGAAARAHFGVLRWLELPAWLNTLAAILLIDCWMYAWHRTNHRIAFLWRFHRVHHSDPDLDVTTSARFHVGEITLSSILRLGVFSLLGVTLWQVLLYEICLVPVIQFHHSNVALPERWDKALRWLIVSPNMHRVHHSRWQPETDSNYSSIFSFWDRLARTFRQRTDAHTISFGLDELDHEERQTVVGLLLTPLARVRRGSSAQHADPVRHGGARPT